MEGKSHVEAARFAGVDRKTVYNWINKDPAFKAALESWRQRAMSHAEDQLTQAAATAASTLAAAAGRDYRAAALLLKGRGVLSGKRETPPDNALTQVLSLPPTRRRAFELRLRELILSFREEPEKPQKDDGIVKEIAVPRDPATGSPTALPALSIQADQILEQ